MSTSKKIKILFDVGKISKKKYGMTYAALEQMKALKKFNNIELDNFVTGLRGLNEHLRELKNEDFKVLKIRFPNKILKIMHSFRIPFENIICSNYDYFLQIGLHANRNISKKEYILSIHDAVGLRYPDQETPFPNYSQKLIDKSAKIITVSEFSKSEILHFLKVAPNKIHVVPNGCNFERFNTRNDKKLFEKIKIKYSLPEKYFLTYGGNTPRKNIKRLCEVFAALEKECYPLVMFGQPKTNLVKSKNILRLGYLPEKEVEIILKNAFALIFPSYYGGFGMPILEAMACGIPVVCSNAASLPEVSGGNALFFDPFSEKDMREKILKLYNDNKIRKQNIRNGLQWVKDFTWERSAKKLIEAITC